MLEDLYQFFSNLFDTHGWVARWVCGRWTPALGWTYIVSSSLIGAAYFAIPVILLQFINKRRDILPFNNIFWLFIVFIFSCGITHFADAAMFWYPAYRFSAMVLFITALVSWAAVFGLAKIIPIALSYKSPAQLEAIIQQRTVELEKTNAELISLNQQLTAANRQTELLMRQKDEFLNIASHELKTPVTSIKGAVQIIEDIANKNSQYQPIAPFITRAAKQINKLNFLIDDLLDITKIQAGKLVIKPGKFRVLSAMHEWVESASFSSNSHQIKIEATEDYEIEADKNRLEQVVINLISNAIKYSPGAEKVIINITNEEQSVRVAVIDFGIGIQKDKIPFVFDRFFRAKEEHIFSGLGLGLYISSEIIKQHGGTIGVTSEENKGSCFWFTLPINKQVILN